LARLHQPQEIMRALFLLLYLSIHMAVLSAQTTADSLWQIWQDESAEDTIRGDALLGFIYEDLFYTQVDSAIILGITLFEFNQEIRDSTQMVDAAMLVGYASFRAGNYPQAFAYYDRGLEVAEALDDKAGMAGILLQTGFIYHDNGDIIKALTFYQRSLKLSEEIDDAGGIGSVYNEFGNIYKGQGDYVKALEYYYKNIELKKGEVTDANSASVYTNIADIYSAREEYDQALLYFEKSLKGYEEKEDKLGIASALAGIGGVNIAQGNVREALQYFHKSLSISESIDDIQGLVATLLSIAYLHFDQGRHDLAIKHCKRCLTLAQKLEDIDAQSEASDCLYEAYRAIGNTSGALEQLEQTILLDDSLKSNETSQKIQQLEFSNQLVADSLIQVEKDLKVKLAHQIEVSRKDRNRNFAIGAGIFFLFLAGGFFSRWRYVQKSKAIIEKEKNRSEALLLNILPAEIAEELKEKGEADARDFELTSILFTDFKDYTAKSAQLTAKELIGEINHCFMAFDHICGDYGIEKIKTIGDSYMAAGGLPVPSDTSTQNTILAALDMQSFINERFIEKNSKGEIAFEMRLGIHTGPVVAGIVGVKKFQYDIWGDTVNTASRMENNGEVGKVNISNDTYELLKDYTAFTFQSRGKIKVKGKKEMEMWFVELAPSDMNLLDVSS
ncbi:MAG: adenylate cyclase, partial [Saprospiraceae bacterium]